MKTLIAILSCHALRHYEQAQRDTWIKDIPAGVDYKFFLGNKEGVHDSSLRIYDADEVHLDVSDGWSSITEKCVAMFRWALEQNYDFVWKMDLDTFVRPKELLSKGFETHDWVGGQNNFFASGGSGYGVSKRSMERIVARPIDTTCEEDVHTARALLEQNIQLHADTRFKFYPGAILTPDTISYHLSSVKGWNGKYNPQMMRDAYAATGEYSPENQPRPIRFRRLR